MKSIEERFWEKVHPEPNSGCWLWTASTMGGRYGKGSSYGQFRFTKNAKDKNQYAHRVAYFFSKGPIPAGLQIDHICGVKICCNPDHLEAVTASENVRRAWKTKRALK